MALNLRGALKKSRSGSIGFWRINEDGEKEKVWLDEDKFMGLLDKEDTKRKLLEFVAPGRKTVPEGYNPKQDISEIRPQGGAMPKEPVDDTKDDLSDIESFSQKPKVLERPESVLKKPTAPEQTPTEKIMSKAGQDPYTKKDEYEAVTPENYDAWKKQVNENFERYYDNKYGQILNNVNPVEAAKRTILNNEEDWTEQFFAENGHPDWEAYLIDDYRKDPKNRELFYDYDRWMTIQKQETLKIAKAEYGMIQKKAKDDIFYHKEQTDKMRERMKEQIKRQEEEAEKYTTENIVKDTKALEKAIANRAKAVESVEATEGLDLEIKMLKERLGIKEETVKETAGLKKEDEVEKYLDKEGLSEEDKERYRKEYNRRLKLAGKK